MGSSSQPRVSSFRRRRSTTSCNAHTRAQALNPRPTCFLSFSGAKYALLQVPEFLDLGLMHHRGLRNYCSQATRVVQDFFHQHNAVHKSILGGPRAEQLGQGVQTPGCIYQVFLEGQWDLLMCHVGGGWGRGVGICTSDGLHHALCMSREAP